MLLYDRSAGIDQIDALRQWHVSVELWRVVDVARHAAQSNSMKATSRLLTSRDLAAATPASTAALTSTPWLPELPALSPPVALAEGSKALTLAAALLLLAPLLRRDPNPELGRDVQLHQHIGWPHVAMHANIIFFV